MHDWLSMARITRIKWQRIALLATGALIFIVLIYQFSLMDTTANTLALPVAFDRSLAHQSVPDSLSRLDHLIMVPGHAIYLDTAQDLISARRDAVHWYLESFQRGQSVSAYVDHIEKAVAIAKEDPNSLLIFSGGQTRHAAGYRTEGSGYWQLAEKVAHWFENDTIPWPNRSSEHVSHRTTTEEFARDSFENILFSLCRFREMTGRYPSRYTVIGHDFKASRFTHVLLPSIRWPKDQFAYVGVTMDVDSETRKKAEWGELKNAVEPLRLDPYGCRSPLLDKKQHRNPFRRHPPYAASCPELRDLLSYCGPQFNGPLPWSIA